MRLKKKVSVIITAYNEEKNLPGVIRECKKLKKYFPIEIVVVQGGSKDKTVQAAQKEKVDKIVSFPHKRGKGADFWAGGLASNGEYIIQIDADHQFQPFEIPLFINQLEKGADIVIGTRFNGGNIEEGSVSSLNMLGNWLMSSTTSLATGIRITDVMAGFKGFTRKAFLALDIKEPHFEYEAEVVVKAVKMGMKLVQQPITYKKRVQGNSGIRAIQDGLNVSKAILKVYFSIPGKPLGKGVLGGKILKVVIPLWLFIIPLLSIPSFFSFGLGAFILKIIVSSALFFGLFFITKSWFASIVASGVFASFSIGQATEKTILDPASLINLTSLYFQTDPLFLIILFFIVLTVTTSFFLEEKRIRFLLFNFVLGFSLSWFFYSPEMEIRNNLIPLQAVYSLSIFWYFYKKEPRLAYTFIISLICGLFFFGQRVFLDLFLESVNLGTLLSLLLLEVVSFKKTRGSLAQWRRIYLFVLLIIVFICVVFKNLFI